VFHLRGRASVSSAGWWGKDQAVNSTSNPDKVLFPDDGITKADLVEYYEAVAKVMVPHFLAAQACVTPHMWLSRADRADRPDRLIFDLDPSTPDVEAVRDAARSLRTTLEDLGQRPFVQTTGSRGFHVVVPLDRRADFDEVRSFARGVADVVVEGDPTRFTTEQRRDKRGDRVYLDIMRNACAQTSVPPYAVRAREGAPVARRESPWERGKPAVRGASHSMW
jgi:bifunctional non-homologous end joining protein LigD